MEKYKILGLSYPFEVSDLKSNFRKLALKYHPDTSESEDTVKDFMKVTEAYNYIMNHIEEYCVVRGSYENELKEIPVLKNGHVWDVCSECNGTGKVFVKRYRKGTCPYCGGEVS